MQPESFAYWLQGFFEISGAETLNKEQVDKIKNHLNLVFYHVIDPKEQALKIKETMNNIHSGIDETAFAPNGDQIIFRC